MQSIWHDYGWLIENKLIELCSFHIFIDAASVDVIKFDEKKKYSLIHIARSAKSKFKYVNASKFQWIEKSM